MCWQKYEYLNKHQIFIDENWYLASFKPAEQLSLNNQRWFTLVKAIKLCSEVEKRKNEEFCELVTFKNANIFTSTKHLQIKINIQLVSNLLNNFLLIIKGDLLWLKPSNYALKLTNKKMHIKYYEKHQQFTSIKTNFDENSVTSIFRHTKQLLFNNSLKWKCQHFVY